jgi:hypothetical protein
MLALRGSRGSSKFLLLLVLPAPPDQLNTVKPNTNIGKKVNNTYKTWKNIINYLIAIIVFSEHKKYIRNV